ncbi:YchJ family protein [Rhizobium sp. TRM95796]|uniref:YchJ family protein n=1 Tax=Rhizobium sp. TRM95796 TaxID=2979862 RepID=UPI0021E7A24A|nr:YchJ family metal-binding protein [Rhizobium sp. TRM95796]MCV3767894.1 YchJ family metal-binding protein [Rhizobium sp. TRM95796]
MREAFMIACPCGSGRFEISCCDPYLAGKPAPTAESLMRSRYTAFTRGDLDHIERTCAGEARLAFHRASLALSIAKTEWLGLTIEDVRAGGEEDEKGTVRFTVRYREGGRLFSQTETSEFQRLADGWRYMRGDVGRASQPAATASGRNNPCPCGSGKKFKKCCGAG